MTVGRRRVTGAWATEVPAVSDAGLRPPAGSVDSLLLRVADGDQHAFAGLCDLIGGGVYGLVQRIVRDPAQAERLTTHALQEVWRTAPRFSPGDGSGISWILTIARRRAMRHAWAADRPVAGHGHSMVEWLPAHPGLASLPAPEREALLLASCGYTWPQVADMTGVPAVTAAERLRAGLLRLGRRVE